MVKKVLDQYFGIKSEEEEPEVDPALGTQ